MGLTALKSDFSGNPRLQYEIYYIIQLYFILVYMYYYTYCIFITVRRLRFINPRSSYLMKYAPPEDERYTVLGWKTHSGNEYVSHYLQKREEHGFRRACTTS